MKLAWRRLKKQRLTFDELYPDAEDNFQPEKSSHLVFKAPGPAEPCWRCKKPTKWIELSFEARMCSPACDDEAWADYWRAVRYDGSG